MIDENANGCIMADEMGLGKTVLFNSTFMFLWE
jgi:SNF2 family DNA or RNA helicase